MDKYTFSILSSSVLLSRSHKSIYLNLFLDSIESLGQDMALRQNHHHPAENSSNEVLPPPQVQVVAPRCHSLYFSSTYRS